MPTKAEIEAARTPKGGWTRKQLAAWGVPWPPPKGWKKALEFGHDLDMALAATGPRYGIYPLHVARLANRAALRDPDPDRLPWE